MNWRQRLGAFIGGFDAGLHHRRLRGFQATRAHVNALIAASGPDITARARWLVRNNGYASNAVDAFANHVVGDGIKLSSKIADAPKKEELQKLWLAWTDEADADGLTDFYGLQAMVAREMFVAGECFVRLRPRRAEDGLLVPLQLQLLQSEMLPFEKTETDPNGNRIRCGIEFDRIGRRVAYHFRRRHPGDSTDQRVAVPETVRVPAEEVLHIYRKRRPGQLRDVSWLAPVLLRLRDLGDYEAALLMKAKIEACLAAVVTEETDILDAEGSVIGKVTSGGFGPTLNAPCAMGYVAKAHSAPGTPLHLIVRGKPLPAVVAAMPFVPNGYKR